MVTKVILMMFLAINITKEAEHKYMDMKYNIL
jgi:hypothetical protein